jgi:ABC-type transport system involved in cytochrome bd biosynthesis fused ATPase/permease subunit
LRVGYEDDRAFLFSGSVLGNVRLGDPDAAPEAVADVLERVGLGAWLERLPGGLETDVGESGRKVSGGQRRRLALARALLADFPILVLDEPISGLDPATARDVMDDLLAATVGRTLVLITHHALGLDRMDENVVLEDGRIVDRGAHDDLLERSARYRRMWDVTRSGTGDTRPK